MQDVFFAFLAIFGSRSPARYDPPADPKAARGTDHAPRLRKAQDLLSAAKRSSALRGTVRTKNTSGAADVIRRARGHRRCCRRPRSRPKASIPVRSPLRPDRAERIGNDPLSGQFQFTVVPSTITVQPFRVASTSPSFSAKFSAVITVPSASLQLVKVSVFPVDPAAT